MNEELEQATEYYNFVSEFLMEYSFKIVGAIVLLLIGIFIANKVANVILALLLRRNIDVTLSNFAASTLKIIIITFVAIMALGKVDISVTPFVAAIGALSLGAGLALQGLLANYGAGIAIILTRPFIVGDTVQLLGVAGIVSEVKLGYTILTNEDGVLITIPNKHITGEIIHNSKDDSIVELTVGIAYHCQPEETIALVKNALAGIDGISDEREVLAGIENFGDSSIDIGIRFWVKTEAYYQTKYVANQIVHKTLVDNNIDIPFPQRDVHLVQPDASSE